ncbi:caspase family protein [Flavivirga amylovorans]|uniref:Caspase family protein n=1 Tax=Flavivirga amylovorans TaxID=870486 RepID=A0ABT8WYN2_9FLAO|nr:caspase family protein [Flavivirga amylovorans]MDO5986742.1 caspase family protein [Flavivirga amylovorans]
MAIQQNDYALLIGIWDYPEFRSLKGPKKDIELFSKWLLNTEKGGGVSEENINIITSTANPVSPIHSQVDQALTDLYEKVSQADQPGRRLYFYFSGHGFGIEEMSIALALANWKLFGMRNSALKSDAYLNEFVNWGKFKEVIFFLDCCRSPIEITGLHPIVGYGRSEDASDVGKFIAHSTRHLNAAYEASFSDDNLEDEALKEEYNGIFTKVLLDALWGDASSGTGVTASELKNYLDRYVKLEANRKQKPQRADIYNALNDDSVFGVSKNLVNIKINFKPERTGLIQLLSPNLDIIKEEDISSNVWNHMELTKGRYTLVEVTTQKEETYKVLPSDSTQTILF